MDNQVHHDLHSNRLQVKPLRSTACHLIFVDPAAVDTEQRLQEVLLVSPTIDFVVHRMRLQDAVGQISETLNKMEPQSVQSLWIISGNELSANSGTVESKKRNSILDKRIAEWQVAFSADTICYLMGDNLVDLADQVERLTGAEVRRDFDRVMPTRFDEIIFIDHAAQNFEPFVKEILLERDADIVTLDPTADGLLQVAQHLRDQRGIKAIHLICPGNADSLVLGQSVLNQNSITKNYLPALREIGRSLASDGEIRIYNNQFNSGNRGINLIRELSSGSGAFVIVASSKSQTLEFDSDFLTRFSPASSQPAESEEWSQLLAPICTPADDGLKTMRASDPNLIWNPDHTELVIRTEFDRVQAIGWACVGFAAGGTSLAILFGLRGW